MRRPHGQQRTFSRMQSASRLYKSEKYRLLKRDFRTARQTMRKRGHGHRYVRVWDGFGCEIENSATLRQPAHGCEAIEDSGFGLLEIRQCQDPLRRFLLLSRLRGFDMGGGLLCPPTPECVSSGRMVIKMERVPSQPVKDPSNQIGRASCRGRV